MFYLCFLHYYFRFSFSNYQPWVFRLWSYIHTWQPLGRMKSWVLSHLKVSLDCDRNLFSVCACEPKSSFHDCNGNHIANRVDIMIDVQNSGRGTWTKWYMDGAFKLLGKWDIHEGVLYICILSIKNREFEDWIRCHWIEIYVVRTFGDT